MDRTAHARAAHDAREAGAGRPNKELQFSEIGHGGRMLRLRTCFAF